MPQVGLENLVCVEDRKVSCENLVDGAASGERRPDPPPVEAEDPDFPAGSFEVRIGDEIEWADLNAVYDREDSTKGSTNPKSNHASQSGPVGSNSQRFSANLKAKSLIIALPGKIQHSGYEGRSARRPPHGWIFPKKAGRAEGGGGRKSSVTEWEPGSPKVSCFGKVLSNRERKRCRRECQEAAAEDGKGRGFWANFAVIFRCGGGDRTAKEEKKEKKERKITLPSKNTPAVAWSVPESAEQSPAAADAEAETEAPVLGEMRRFVSGRRAASWAAEAVAEVEAGERMDRAGSRGRRSAGSVEDWG